MLCDSKPLRYQHFIDGELVDGDSFFDVLNPATGEAFAMAPHPSRKQAEDCVKAARKAFPAWASKSMDERKAIVMKCVDVVKNNFQDFVALLTKEQGKPIASATMEMGGIIHMVQEACNIQVPVEVYKDTATMRVEVQRKPLGVVACITPWNFPMWCSACKWLPAMVLGNTVVVKPSPFTPLTVLLFAKLAKDVFPQGVFNVIAGDDKSDFNVGAFLTGHPLISKVSFTGSVPTGKKIMAKCSNDVKRVTLEMGGNDAAIVRADCDPKKVAAGVFRGAFSNTGQVCCAIKRVYVHESIFDKFKAEIVEQAKKAVVGDGTEEGVEYGPLNNKMQLDKVSSYVEDARKAGAEILCGGRKLGPEEVKGGKKGTQGFFYAPTIIAGVKEGVKIVDEEQFGPALPIMSYATDEEAIKRANNSTYGLGGSVWSQDIAKANQMASRLLAGTVWVNTHLAPTGAPFGGFKQSGLGREFGKSHVTAFTEMQTLQLAKADIVTVA